MNSSRPLLFALLFCDQLADRYHLPASAHTSYDPLDYSFSHATFTIEANRQGHDITQRSQSEASGARPAQHQALQQAVTSGIAGVVVQRRRAAFLAAFLAVVGDEQEQQEREREEINRRRRVRRQEVRRQAEEKRVRFANQQQASGAKQQVSGAKQQVSGAKQ